MYCGHSGPQKRHQQRGAALLIAVFIALTVSLAFLFGSAEKSGGDYGRETTTEGVLAQAKAALIGFAATYREAHPNKDLGYFPCPDTENKGEAQPNCGADGETMIGRLPYKTLGLPDLRSADGECLWYMVSGSHKDNPKSTPLNWDSRGQIRVQNLSGSALADPADDSGGAVAVIIAPGAPLSGQNRPAGALNCSGDASNSLTSYLDGNYTEATSGILTVVAGQPQSNVSNDRLAWISARELFTPIARRIDMLGTLLPQLVTCLNFTSSNSIPDTTAYSTTSGTKKIVSAAGIDEVILERNCILDEPAKQSWANWKDHFRYIVCNSPSTNCLQVNAAACSGVLLFGGRLNNGNPRTTAEQTALNSYFDAGNVAALTGAATSFTGQPFYSGSPPRDAADDVALCLMPDPLPPALSFQSNIGDLSSIAVNYDGKSMASVDNTAQMLTLGANGLSGSGASVDPAQLFGCSWFGTTLPFRNGLRAYFRYRIINRGEGFVFVVADADPTRNPGTSMCGRGDASLGYSGLPNNGTPISGLTVSPIQYPKIGLEIDTSWDSERNDTNSNHMAIVYWGDPTLNDDDNIHGASVTAIAGNPQNPVAKTNTAVNDINTYLHVRLEIIRSPISGGHSYTTKAWVLNYLPPDFDLLNVEFDEDINAATIHTSATIPDLAADNEALRNIRIGFTNAASAYGTTDQQIQISNFAIRISP